MQEEDEEAATAAGAEGGVAGQGTGMGLSMQERLAQQRQIFNPREAFSMLSRELKDIMRQNDPMLEVDTVESDVYHWDIHLYKFEGSHFAEVSIASQQQPACSLWLTELFCPNWRAAPSVISCMGQHLERHVQVPAGCRGDACCLEHATLSGVLPAVAAWSLTW